MLSTEYLTTGLHYYNQLFPYFSPYNSYLSQAVSYISPHIPAIQSTIDTLSTQKSNLLNQPPDLTSILILAAAFVIGLKILGFLKRLVIGWVVFLFQLVFWTAVAALALFVSLRGWDRSLADVNAWANELGTVWGQEKSRWEDVARQAGRSRGYGRGYDRGTGRWT